MRVGLFAVLVLMVAGCVGTPAAPRAPGFSVAPEIVLPATSDGAEPSLAILPDGTLMAVAPSLGSTMPDQTTGAEWIWGSTDHGASWTVLQAPSPTYTPVGYVAADYSADSDVAASPDGWVYASDWWFGNAGLVPFIAHSPDLPLVPDAPAPFLASDGNFVVTASHDGGHTWSSSPVTTLDGFQEVDRQWLVAGADGFVALFYAYYHPVADDLNDIANAGARGDYTMSIQAVLSHDHAQTWSSPVTVAGPIHGGEELHAKPFLTSTGRIVMPYTEVLGDYLTDPGTVMVAYSDDQGSSWTRRSVGAVPEGNGGLWPMEGAADASGHVFLAWNARAGNATVLRLARSADGGATWDAARTLVSDGINLMPGLAARGNGQLAIGWYSANATGDPRRVANDTAWNAELMVSSDGGATWQRTHASTSPVKLGPLCPFGAACSRDRELLDFVSLGYDADGRLHFVFSREHEDSGFPSARVAYARSA